MDDTEDYDIGESIRSFRRAGSKVLKGLAHLYHGGKARIENQHVVVQVVIGIGMWFAGNWVYDRIAPQLSMRSPERLRAFPLNRYLH